MAGMKITRLEISGFKSLKHVVWEPGDLNVLIGPNGSGKSNLLILLNLISLSAQKKLWDTVKKSGGFRPLLWNESADPIQVKIQTYGEDVKCTNGHAKYWYSVDIGPEDGNYRIQHEKLEYLNQLQLVLTDGSKPLSLLEKVTNNQEQLSPVGNGKKKAAIPLRLPEGELDHLECLLPIFAKRVHDYPDVFYFARQLEKWSVYQDVNFGTRSPVRLPAVTREEKVVESDAGNLISVLHTLYNGRDDFRESIDNAMSAAFGDEYDSLDFPEIISQRRSLVVRWKSLKQHQSIYDLSDGTLKFLFLLTVLANPDPSPLVAIDEPELGLHPSMLPIIAEYATEAATRTQVVFTTHSPQFLDAFRDTQPTTSVFGWEDGATTIRNLRKADLEYWIKDYSLGSLFSSGELEQMD